MLPFKFEHVFNCDSTEKYWQAYFSDELGAIMDRELNIAHTEVLMDEDDGAIRRRTIRKKPERQLPGFIQKLKKGDIQFTQKMVFHKADNRIDIEVIPSLFEGKSSVQGEYIVELVGPGQVKRTYAGNIEVNVKLIGGRIEKWVRDDLEKSLEQAQRITQTYIDEVLSRADS